MRWRGGAGVQHVEEIAGLAVWTVSRASWLYSNGPGNTVQYCWLIIDRYLLAGRPCIQCAPIFERRIRQGGGSGCRVVAIVTTVSATLSTRSEMPL